MGYSNINIDLVSLLERETGNSYPKVANHYRFGAEHAGPCPFCGTGRDRFHVFPEGERPHWFCRVCEREGSPVKFLKEYRKISWAEAFAELGIGTAQGGTRSKTFEHWRIDKPCDAWQEHAESLVHKAQQVLWSAHGREALNYLYQRGFTDETIQQAKLGYIPVGKDGKWMKQPLEEWGLPVKDPAKPDITLFEGILIPWLIGGVPWKLEVRRLTNVDPDRRLPQLTGSADCFYNFDAIQPGQPVVLVESAFDALSGMQACNGEVIFLATGGTKKLYHHASWRNVLKPVSCVLLSFDNDEPDEKGVKPGDACARCWKEHINHSMRWKPIAHDINDMLTQSKSDIKFDIRAWVQKGLDVYQCLQEPEHQEPEPPLQGERQLGTAEIADRFVAAFPDWQVEMMPTEDAYKLAPIWPPVFDYWAMLENKLGKDFNMSPTPPNAYWHHAGNEHMPVPTIYQHHYNPEEYPSAQQVEQAQSCQHKVSTERQRVYTAWLSSNEPALRWKAISELNA